MTVDPTFATTEIRVGAEGKDGGEAAASWLELITKAKAEFGAYHVVSDEVDKLYASLERHAGRSGDREFQIFWANLEVLRPSIYARAPVPVVTPRFSDRKALPRKASQVLERALVTLTVESELHGVLKMVRDDLARNARGVPWVRLNEDGEVEFEHIQREDFLCDPARSWMECRWVARQVFMSRGDVQSRFPDAQLPALGFNDETKREIKDSTQVQIWEIWHKAEKAVVYVAEGVKEVLKRSKPPVDFSRFYPCPQPAFGTIQPGSLIPVPDMVFYKDQIDEIDALTRRISALTDMIRLKGFFDSAAAGAKDAIEAAFNTASDAALLVPVAGLGQLATGGGRLIEWFPVTEAANAVQVLIGLRRQLVDDVYQITGLSDIMRGSTVASETATAQNLKAQYGSVRVRERQEEMVRVARDLYRLAAEIMAEKMSGDKLLAMAQVDDLPKRADIKRQIREVAQQAKASAAQVQAIQAQGQQVDPQQIEQAAAQAQAEIARMDKLVTVEAVQELLRDDRIRPFALDVETDSTIAANEDAEKSRRTELMGAVGQFMGQAMPLVEAQPEAGPLVAAMLRFVASGFRAGRDLEQPIDDFAEKIEQAAAAPKGPSPEQQATQAEAQAKAQAAQGEMAIKQAAEQREGMVAQADVILRQAQAQKVQAEAQVIEMGLRKQANDEFAAALASLVPQAAISAAGLR